MTDIYIFISSIWLPISLFILYKAVEGYSDKSMEVKKEQKKVAEYSKKNYDLNECIKKKDILYSELKKIDNTSVKAISELYSDFLTLQYDISSKYLKTKSHPAYKEAHRIQDLKKETKKYIEQFKDMQYRYEMMVNFFPELSQYIEDFESIKKLGEFNNIGDFVDEYDHVRDFLSKEEYDKLGVDERNQLALNRYIKGKKSKWQIGRDYEMSCAHEFSIEGLKVDLFGIEKKFEDLGRDLIIYRDNDEVDIVQCKYWSENKSIHENHLAQLYGTTIMYKLENKYFCDKATPVFITNIKLTYMAEKFACELGVLVIDNHPMKEFPRIKCNINNGNKIYHLPFDQQYDRTKIENDGEFYAFTVKEATSRGFRRAFKHFVN